MKPNQVKFDVKSWLLDVRIRTCSPTARAILFDLFCMGAQGDDEPHRTKGTVIRLAKVCRCTPDELVSGLLELIQSGAATVTPELHVSDYSRLLTVNVLRPGA